MSLHAEHHFTADLGFGYPHSGLILAAGRVAADENL